MPANVPTVAAALPVRGGAAECPVAEGCYLPISHGPRPTGFADRLPLDKLGDSHTTKGGAHASHSTTGSSPAGPFSILLRHLPRDGSFRGIHRHGLIS